MSTLGSGPRSGVLFGEIAAVLFQSSGSIAAPITSLSYAWLTSEALEAYSRTKGILTLLGVPLDRGGWGILAQAGRLEFTGDPKHETVRQAAMKKCTSHSTV